MVIKLEPLMDLSDRLLRLRGDLEDESEEVARIFRALQQLSGMEKLQEELQRSRRDMEQQAWFAYQQAKALSQTVRWYDACERRIGEEYEDAAVRYTRGQSSVLDLSPVMDYLK